MPKAAAEAERMTTWRQEALELEERLACLCRKITSTAAVESSLAAKGADEAILRRAKQRRLALVDEFLHLGRTKMDPDLAGAMSDSDRAAEAERLREEKLQEVCRLLQNHQGDARCCSLLEDKVRILEAKARTVDFDLKQGGIYYNSLYWLHDLAKIDHREESPLGPMRFTDRVFEEGTVLVDCVGVNILSVNISHSDIGFPLQVFGTVVARDCIDHKRVYLFQRDIHHPQLITSKKEPLILTGPKRGLVLLDNDYVETDLWVMDHQGRCREFSKGVLTIEGIYVRDGDNCEFERQSLATRLSTVDVRYEVVKCAVEATIAVEVLQGEFCGVIAAHTTSSKRMLVLYDSKATGGNCHGVITLMRPAVSVCVEDKLIILAKTGGGKPTGLEFPSRVNGGNEIVITLGDTKVRAKVAWSIMNP